MKKHALFWHGKIANTVFKQRALAFWGTDIREGRRAALSSTWEGIGQMAVAGAGILSEDTGRCLGRYFKNSSDYGFFKTPGVSEFIDSLMCKDTAVVADKYDTGLTFIPFGVTQFKSGLWGRGKGEERKVEVGEGNCLFITVGSTLKPDEYAERVYF